MLSSAAPVAAHDLHTTSTPPSYYRANFPDLPAHVKRYVGILACQRDPLLTTLTTEVVRCDKRVVEPAAKAKKGKGVAVEEVQDEWEVELLDTVLFPEGGGQPSDVGSITVLSDTPTTVQVREVLRRNLDAVHFVSGPLPVGSTVRVDIDVAGRNDKMAQHTGQHLLSAIIDRDLQVDTLSWSLSPFPQPCYIELGRAPTPEEITKIQDECNALIRESRAVSVEVQLAGEEGGVETPGSVPSNYQAEDGRKGVVRTVEIEKLDRNPCCGTHFPSLSHLQSIFILPNTSTIRGTNTRLSFVVGPRVLHQLLSTHTTVRTASLEINCAASDLSDRVAALQLAQKDTLKREKRLREELAGFVGEALWTRASATPGSCVGASLREEDSTNSMEFLQAVAAALKSQLETSTSPERPHLFLLACGPTPGPGVVGGTVVITGTEEMVTRAGKAMAVSFGARIKGGGKGKWQGKLAGKWEKGDLALLEAVVAGGAQ